MHIPPFDNTKKKFSTQGIHHNKVPRLLYPISDKSERRATVAPRLNTAANVRIRLPGRLRPIRNFSFKMWIIARRHVGQIWINYRKNRFHGKTLRIYVAIIDLCKTDSDDGIVLVYYCYNLTRSILRTEGVPGQTTFSVNVASGVKNALNQRRILAFSFFFVRSRLFILQESKWFIIIFGNVRLLKYTLTLNSSHTYFTKMRNITKSVFENKWRPLLIKGSAI